MNATVFLVSTLFNLYLMVVILRLWLHLAGANFYNPLSQFVVKATHPIVGPMRRVIPSIGRFDTATFILAIAVVFLKIITITAILGTGTFNVLALLVISLVSFVDEFLYLMFIVLIIRAIMSFVSQGGNPIEMLFQQLTDPFLAPIRRVIPPMGGFDLSVLIAIIAIQFSRFLLEDIFGKLPY